MRGLATYTQAAAKTGGDDITQHVGLVKRIANHLMGRLPATVQVDDLVQAGLIGLLEAKRQYDPGRGANFETYATIRIRGAMLDEIRSNNWTPRSVFRKGRLLSEAIQTVENKHGSSARAEQVAEVLGVSLDEYHQMLSDAQGHAMFSLDDLVEDGDENRSTPDIYQQIESDEFKQALAEAISGLPERERMVVALYYDEDLTLREIGEVLGVSESRVCQIHSQATLRLQSRMRTWLS